MACCSYNCLKQYVMYSGIIALILGLAALLYSFITIEQQGEDFTELDAYASYNIFLLVLLGLGLFLFGMGLFGTCGGWRQNKCCISTFKVCNVMLALVFLVLGVVAVIFIYVIGDDIADVDTCYDNFYFKKTAEYDQIAQQMFCTTDCPCYIDSDSIINDIDITKSNDEKDIKIQECEQLKKDTELIKGNYSGFLKQMEKTFGCAGFCEKAPYYHFTDINKEVEKEESCAELIGNEIATNFFIYMIVCFTVSFLLCTNVCVARCVNNKQSDRAKEYVDKKAVVTGGAVAGGVVN